MENTVLPFFAGHQVLTLMPNAVKPIQNEENQMKKPPSLEINEPSMIKPTISEFSGEDTNAHLENVIARFLDTITHTRHRFLGKNFTIAFYVQCKLISFVVLDIKDSGRFFFMLLHIRYQFIFPVSQTSSQCK